MKRVFFLQALTVFLMVGCDPTITSSGLDTGSKGEPAEPGDPEPGDPEPEALFEPHSGDWVIIESSVLSDDCGLPIDRGQVGADFDLQSTSDLVFDMTFSGQGTESGGGENVVCELNGALGYDCDPAHSVNNTPADSGLNAQIQVELECSGEFVSDFSENPESDRAEDELHNQTIVSLDCTGPDCGWVTFFTGAHFPCDVVQQTISVPK